MSNSVYPLLETVDNLEEKNHHSMVLYDDVEYGSQIIKQFLENGLKKNEHAVYFSPGDISLLEKEMKSAGLDIDYYKRKNLLHFYQIEDITKRSDGIRAGYDDTLKKITADSKEPLRIVGKIIPDVSTKEGILAELQSERIFHMGFDNHNCSFLCPYDVSDIEEKDRSQWIGKLLSLHHNLIYATKPEKAVTFDTDLLITDDLWKLF